MSNATMHRLAIIIGLGLVLTSAVAPVARARTPTGQRPVTAPTGPPPAGAPSGMARLPSGAPLTVRPRFDGRPAELTLHGSPARTGSEQADPEPLHRNFTVPVEITIARPTSQPEQLRITYRFDFSAASQPVEVSLPNTRNFHRNATRTVIDTTGLTVVRKSNESWGIDNLRWTPNQTARPSATVRITTEGVSSVGSLTVIRRGSVVPDFFSIHRNITPRVSFQFATTSGLATKSYLIVGPYSVYTVAQANETIRLVIPAQTRADLAAPPVDIQAAYRAASRQLRLTTRHEQVTIFVGPASVGSGIIGPGITTGDTAFVSPTAGLPAPNRSSNTPGNTWFHEYVHTQQNRWYGPQMEWYREAEASYYAGLLELNQDRISYTRFWHDLNTTTIGYLPAKTRRWANRTNTSIALLPGPDATLANQSSWRAPDGANTDYVYRRGPPVLALLDAKIRRATRGRASLMNVSRAMNRQRTADEPVTLTEFKHILGRYLSNQTINRFVARYVTGQAPVSLPRERALYQLPPVPVNRTPPSPRPTPPPTPAPDLGPQPVDAVEQTLQRWLATGRTRSRALLTPVLSVLPCPVRAPIERRPLLATGGGAFLLLAVLRRLIGR